MTDFEPDDIKDHYRSGTSILSRDFFIPCLKACHRYRRAVAYFSTNALLEWVEIVDDILDNQIKIELLLSPNLSKQDLEALKDLNKENKI
jgi:transcription termination factor NusB